MPLLYSSFLGRGGAGGGVPSVIEYVGGKAVGTLGVNTSWTTSLTDLTGGLASAPAAGDIVIVAYGTASGGDEAIGLITADYNEVVELFADDTVDANLSVNWKLMTGTPDTSVEMSQTFSTSNAGVVAISVWRGVHPSSPLDVTTTTATGINSPNPDPPSITPVTSGAVIVVCGTSPHIAGIYTAPDLSNFISQTSDDTLDCQTGMGSKEWTGGPFNPGAWLADVQTSRAWCAATLALRPA